MRNFSILAALAALLGSCAESGELDTVTPEEEQIGGILISATISLSEDNGSDTKVSSDYGAETWTFTWDAADATDNVFAYCEYTINPGADFIYKGYESIVLECSDLKDDDITATFTGTLNSNLNYYRLLYAADGATASYPTNSSDTATIDLTTQNGELDNLVMISDQSPTSTEDQYLQHLGCFYTFDISFTDIPNDWNSVEVEKIVVSGLNSKASCYSFSSSSLTGESYVNGYTISYTSSDITITPTDTDYSDGIEVNINFFKTTIANGESLSVKVYFTNDSYATSSITNNSGSSIIFERAKFYEQDFTCIWGSDN